MIKLVTVVFADVVGSTAQAETMVPEDTRALMAEFFEAMSEEIRAEGGTIERLIGDAIMADFGVPVAREDDAERAVRAARRMFTRLKAWNASRPPEQQIRIRIGINTGAVSTGGSLGEQLMVMGDAVNIAARLQEAAEPGMILLGGRTARAVRRSFRLREAQPIAAKGKAEPVQAFAVEEELEHAEDATMLRAPMVGRGGELEALRDVFARTVRDRSPHLVTIVGEPGVGKSRLLQEFTASLGDEATVLAGRCLPYGDGVTLAPLQEILRAEAGIFPQDEPDLSLKKVEKLVQEILGELPAAEIGSTSAALASTISPSPALETLADLDPRSIYREMVRAWRAVLTGIVRGRSLAIVIEDLYWADQTMLDVLTDLSEHVEGPILFLCTARPDFVVSNSDWFSQLRSHSTLRIEPLDRAHSEDLVRALLGAGVLPNDLTERVLARAEGNPLFLEEILLRLVDEGYLTEDDGSWTVTGDLSEIEVPERVQTLIQARLELLSPRERGVIQAGAVVGRHFWSGALERMTGFADVQDIIDGLKPRQMFVERLSSAIPGEIEYLFRHVLIRDVAYESLPRKARSEAHAAAGKWIEAIRGPRGEEAAELLADHYERAYEGIGKDDLRTSARHYYLVAAQSALRRFAIGQAERFGGRAVELSLPGTEKAEALETLGDAFYLALRGNPAWDAYVGALAELEGTTPRDDARFARSAAKATIVPTRWIGTMDEEVAADDVDRVIEAGLRAAGDRDCRERAMLLSARAFLAGTAERPGDEAEASAREGVAMAQRLGDPDLISAAMDARAVLLWPTGCYREISSLDRARLELIGDLSDEREIADILLSAGRDLTRVGEYEEALGYLDRAVDTVEGVDPGQYLHTLVHRSVALFFLGKWDRALADLARIESLETVSAGDVPPYAVRAIGIGYFCSQLREEGEDAARFLTMLRAHREGIEGPRFDAFDPLAVPARAVARSGHVSEAMTWLSFESPGLCEHLEAACDIAAVSLKWDWANDVLARSREQVEYAGLRALEHCADRLEGHLMAAAGDRKGAVRKLMTSAEGFSSLGALWEEAWSRLSAGRLLMDDGASAQARLQFERALPIFEELRLVREARSCREAAVSQ
jgi:class 3 adenylate cyclase/tetratricopeptide (TPR) repeat protein